MDFELSPEQEDLAAGARRLCAGFDLDYWRRCDGERRFPIEFWQALGIGGWLGLVAPPEAGGAGLGMADLAVVAEELAAGGGGITCTLPFGQSLIFATLPILRAGTEAQRRRYLPRLIAGELEACLGLTEPGSGSDALMLSTRAVRAAGPGSGWIVDGQKMFISGSDRAGLMLLIARTSEFGVRTTRGISVFLVDLPAAGVEVTPIDKLGLRWFHSCAVHIDRLRLPPEALLGEEGRGWEVLAEVLNPERIMVTAAIIGTAELCLKLACEHARERRAFDRPVGAFQGVAFPLAEAKARLDAARLLNLRAAVRYDRRLACAVDCSEAKLVGIAAAWDAADRSLQALGGYGYATEYHVERFWRDIRLYRLAPVSEQLTLAQVAERVLGLPRST